MCCNNFLIAMQFVQSAQICLGRCDHNIGVSTHSVDDATAALLREQEKTWHDWFSRADAALYRAKSAGRDSYVIADDLF